jgi:DNA-binding XRE family transcriptional regulator
VFFQIPAHGVKIDTAQGAALAKNVRRLRMAKGLSQDALAADANQHQGLISEIENGRAGPRPSQDHQGKRDPKDGDPIHVTRCRF